MLVLVPALLLLAATPGTQWGAGAQDPPSAPSGEPVLFRGRLYRTLDGWPAVDTASGCQAGELAVPEGWALAPNVPDSVAVAAMLPWGTDCLVLADGSSWNTLNFPPAGGDCWFDKASPVASFAGDRVDVTSCPRRVLIYKLVPAKSVFEGCTRLYSLNLTTPGDVVSFGVPPSPGAGVGDRVCFNITTQARPLASLEILPPVNAAGLPVSLDEDEDEPSSGLLVYEAKTYTVADRRVTTFSRAQTVGRSIVVVFSPVPTGGVMDFRMVVRAPKCDVVKTVAVSQGDGSAVSLAPEEYVDSRVTCFQISATPAPTPSTSPLSLNLEITRINVEPDFDRVYVFDGAWTDSPVLDMMHGLRTSPRVISASGSSLLVVFATNELNSGRAFGYDGFVGKATVTRTRAPTQMPTTPRPTAPRACRSSYNITLPVDGSSRKIQVRGGGGAEPQEEEEDGNTGAPPGDVPYANDDRVCWTLIAPPSTTAYNISFDFDSFDTQPLMDVLTIYSGADATTLVSTLSGTYAAGNPPRPVRVSSSMAHMRWSTDDAVQRKGFVVRVSATRNLPRPCAAGRCARQSLRACPKALAAFGCSCRVQGGKCVPSEG